MPVPYQYSPVAAAPYWDVIGDFVTTAVVSAAPHTPYTERQLFPAATALTMWAWQTAALPLEQELVFSAHSVDRFTAEGMAQYTKAGRGTIRSRLRRMAEALLSAENAVSRERPMGQSDPSAPYTVKEQIALRAWAAGQASEGRRMDASALLSLGLGAGLAGREIVELRVPDIDVDDLGVLVHVRGDRARQVPVLREWEKGLITCVANRSGDGFAFRENQQGSNPNLLTDFVSRSRGKIRLQARRMHATWVVRHLEAGTPLALLLPAAGLREPEALGRFMKFVQQPRSREYRECLRGALPDGR